MKIKVDDIIKDIKKSEKNKKMVMVYFEGQLHDNFKEYCKSKKVRMSSVITELVKIFMEQANTK